MKFSLKERLVLLFSNTAFLLLYTFLHFNNRYAADDHWYAYNVKTKGIIDAAIYVYQTWTPRPAKMLLINCIMSVFDERIALFLFGIVALLLFVVVVKKFFELIFVKLQAEVSNFDLYNLSISFTALFFFSCFSIAETWFWFCSAIAYLFAIVMALWGTYFFITGKGKLLNLCLSILCFLYLFGAAELLAASIAFLMVIGTLVYLLKNRTEAFKNKYWPQFSIITFIGLIVVGFVYLGVGTQFRKSLMPEASVFNGVKAEIISFGILFIKKIPMRLPYILLTGLPFVLLGSKIKELPYKISSMVIKSSVAFVVISSLILLPSSYVMSELAPDRALTLICLLLAAYSALIFIVIGFKYSNSISFQKTVFVLSVFTFIFLGYTAFSQINIVGKYFDAVKVREEKVLAAKQNNFKGVLIVDSLPYSGMLYNDELATDTADHRNKFYKMYYGLEFGVCVKSQKE